LQPGAAIINTASIQAYDLSEFLLDYATTKAGIVAFTKALSKQMIEKNVRVNAVASVPFRTALQPSGGQTQDKAQHSAFGGPGQPVEIVPVYVLLASLEASFVTGEVYGVTGGAGIDWAAGQCATDVTHSKRRPAAGPVEPRASMYDPLALPPNTSLSAEQSEKVGVIAIVEHTLGAVDTYRRLIMWRWIAPGRPGQALKRLFGD
jgi:hypothetical protein